MSENKDDSADPLAEGFRNPPEQVTEPCLTYIARVMELRNFISFYFGFVKTSGNCHLDKAGAGALTGRNGGGTGSMVAEREGRTRFR